MLGLLTDLCEGRGEEGDLELMEAIAEVTKLASLCGLGQTAPNSVLTTMQYFRDEYEAHLREKRCPAGVCKALFSYYIDLDKCKACMICLRNCPAEAIIGEKGQIHVIDQEKCTKCGTCFDVCPDRFGAVTKVSGPVPAPPPPEERVIQKAN
jgi:NADH-quinone oxidoreductase subunit F